MCSIRTEWSRVATESDVREKCSFGTEKIALFGGVVTDYHVTATVTVAVPRLLIQLLIDKKKSLYSLQRYKYDKLCVLETSEPVATPQQTPHLGNFKPEDHWPCKRSPDILTLVKHKTYKTWKINGKEMTLTFNTHITS